MVKVDLNLPRGGGPKGAKSADMMRLVKQHWSSYTGTFEFRGPGIRAGMSSEGRPLDELILIGEAF